MNYPISRSSQHDEWGSDEEALEHALEHAAHLLPEQAPLDSFVHHNTLHAFEHLPFEEAVETAAETFGTQPYLSADEFARQQDLGRILPEDVDAVLDKETPAHSLEHKLWPQGPTRREVWRALLLEVGSRPGPETCQWLLAEERMPGARRSTHQPWSQEQRAKVWAALSRHAPATPAPVAGQRVRRALLERTGLDVDTLVHPLLIRFTAAYLDQGMSYWRLPGQDTSYLSAFRALYARPFGPPDAWMVGLQKVLEIQRTEGQTAQQCILQALRLLKVPEADWPQFITETLLTLRGWAGMVRQLQTHPHRAPVHAPPVRLIDYLAVQLLLEQQAALWIIKEHRLDESLAELRTSPPRRSLVRDTTTTYDTFMVAQHLGLDPLTGAATHVETLLREVSGLPKVRRRALLHRAYERRHRVIVLDALAVAAARPEVQIRNVPFAQAVFCIDDREESTRRHLEEVEPNVETLGFAGFFGVPMAYQGLSDIRPRALCPVAITPKNLVVEVKVGDSRPAKRSLRGRARRSMFVGGRTLFRGTLLSGIVGVLSVLPLLFRVLLPRLSARLTHALGTHTHAEASRLVVKKTDEIRETHLGPLQVGFDLQQRVDIVRSVLTSMGIADRLAHLVVMMGHGSSSLNNPHEAAYDCGATGGGRGGPNARAFAVMANEPEVRQALAKEGLHIPDETFFVGAYHNTCDDAVTYYDLDLIPEPGRDVFARFRTAIDEARRRDANERMRRFETHALDGSPTSTLALAEARAVDLAQPRPEAGHATNAICLVGPRASTLGLFLDRRAFLVSYEPEKDPDHRVLGELLASVGPVGAGINLEYYFSYVDPGGYGSGTKLPHNVTGLIGVMDGHASDLRTGLPWQMVEIHEPVRLLTVVEAEPETLVGLLDKHAGLRQLIFNAWIQVVTWSPTTRKLYVFESGQFVEHVPSDVCEPRLEASSEAAFRGRRGNIDPLLIAQKEVRYAS